MPDITANSDDKADVTLISFGAEVKALDDAGKIGGYLVRYTDADSPDLTEDYFDGLTDFGEPNKLPILYNHGFDKHIGKKRLGTGTVTKEDAGLWMEAQLDMANEYQKKVFELVKLGKLGYSSGAAAHTVEREAVGKAYHIKQWYIAEASLTPTPAEPRNMVMPIKSLVSTDDPASAQSDETVENNITPATMPKESEMEAIEMKGLLDTLKDEIMSATVGAAETAAEEAVKKYVEESAPEVKAGFVTEVEDEADRALKGNPFEDGEFFKAVMNAALYPAQIDQRLLPLKATGLNEAIPSQGGFLVQQDMANGILQRMYPVGSLIGRINPINVQGNGMTFNAIDETSRADGSRYGGIQGYWLNEGGDKTASKPKFNQIELKLKKVAALVYATDELLEDAGALENWITTYVPQELRFKVEDAVMNGDGVGKPFGVLNSTALVSATRTNASAIAAADVANMWARRWVGVSDYVWLCNPDIQPQLQVMTLGQIPVYQPPGFLADAPHGRMLGRPVIETEYNPTLGTLGDLLLFSPSQYAMIQKGGVQSASSIHVQFTTDETAFRFVFRVDGQPYWQAALTPFKGSNTVSPYVALAATT